jgi:glycosyltransferase involved in cell wall biosynthesis
LPGRITKVKQQLLLAKYLGNRIPKEIKILFAGDGEDLTILKSITKNNEQLECLGRVDDMPALYKKVDFVMLFSEKEGLPLTLIEATSYALPVLCNDVGGNLEILENSVNGYLLESLDHLVEVLYRLVDLNSSEYHVLSQNSRSVFENKFEFDTMISNYYNLIKPYVN